jgi:hypothetical protein
MIVNHMRCAGEGISGETEVLYLLIYFPILFSYRLQV